MHVFYKIVQNHTQKMRLEKLCISAPVELKKVLCAQSYGHFIAAQCRSEANKSSFFQTGLKPMPKMRLVESFRNLAPELKKVLCTQSYGHFTAALEFRSQCRSEAEKSSRFQTGLKPMPKDASRRELSKYGPRIEKGALYAELRPFYCSIRILAPMLYMIC